MLDFDFRGFVDQLTNLFSIEPSFACRAHNLLPLLVRLLASDAEDIFEHGIFLIFKSSDCREGGLELVALSLVIERRVAACVWSDCSRGEQLGCDGFPVLIRAANVRLLLHASVLEQLIESCGLGSWLFLVRAMEQAHADQHLVVHSFSRFVFK